MHSRLVTKNKQARKDDELVTVDLWANKRNGSKSTLSWYYIYQGRVISEYEMRIRKWDAPNHSDLFKFIYGPILINISAQDNALLKCLKKEDSWVGGRLELPKRRFR